MNSAWKIIAVFGVLAGGLFASRRLRQREHLDLSWVPTAVEDGNDLFWLPPGWRRGLQHYACLGVYKDKRGKVTYLCRPR